MLFDGPSYFLTEGGGELGYLEGKHLEANEYKLPKQTSKQWCKADILHHCLLVFLFLADQIFYRSYVNRQHFRLRSFASLCSAKQTAGKAFRWTKRENHLLPWQRLIEWILSLHQSMAGTWYFMPKKLSCLFCLIVISRFSIFGYRAGGSNMLSFLVWKNNVILISAQCKSLSDVFLPSSS